MLTADATPRRRWARRTLKILGFALLGAWALYVVAINVLLRTRLLRSLISGKPNEFVVDYATAYSVIPGAMHVKGLSIRGRDSDVEWILHLDRCDFRVALTELASRRFHATRVHGDGLTLRIRRRMPSFTPAVADALAPIAGFTDPPLSGAEPPYLSDLDYNLWSVWLEGVDADHVRELWVDTLRATGDFDIHGRWFFRPMRWLDVGPALLDARAVDVSYGPAEAWVTGAAGQLKATFAPTNLQAVEGAELVDQVSLSGDLHGLVHLAPLVNRALDGAGPKLERADTRFDATLAIDHGAPRSPTRLHLDRFDLSAREGDIDVETRLEVGARIDDDGGAHAEANVRDLRLSRARAPLGAAKSIDATMSMREVNRAHPPSDAKYSLYFDGVETAALAYWKDRFRVAPSLRVDAETATISGHLTGTVAERSAAGHVRLDAAKLSISRDDWRLATDVTGEIDVSASLRAEQVDLSGTELSLRAAGGEARGVAFTIPRLTVLARRFVREPAGILGNVTVEAADIEIPSMTKVGALLPLPTGIQLDGGRGRADVHLDVDLGVGAVAGSAHLGVRALRLRAGSRVMEGSLDVDVKAAQAGPITNVSGSSVEFREASDSGWWARLDTRQAEVSLIGAPRLRAKLDMAAKDASPLTTFIDRQVGAATKLAIGAIPTTGLRATGELVVAPAKVEARSFSARADGLTMGLEFAKIGREQVLAVHLVVGLVDAGVEMTDGKTSVMLFGADPWFAAKTASLRAYERRYE